MGRKYLFIKQKKPPTGKNGPQKAHLYFVFWS